MGKRKFYWLRLLPAIRHSIGWADGIAFLLSVVGMPLIRHFVPAWETAMVELTWQIPLAALAGIVTLRLVLAPYWLYREKVAETERLSALMENKDAPKLAHPELYITYRKHEFGVAGEGKYTGISVDKGTPVLSVEAEFRPTGQMRIETVKLCLVGRRIPSLNDHVQESSEVLHYMPTNIFDISGTSPGKHEAELLALANGEWWRSHPFPIQCPEVSA